MAQASPETRSFRPAIELAAWKSWAGWISAVLLAILFLVSGFWKLTAPLDTAARMIQMLVPPQLGLLAAIGVGLLEAWAGILILLPRWRKWGAWLCIFLLVVFMVYIGMFYNRLTGEDCSCFPWLKRVVGPGFFIGDGIMLLLALVAAIWTRPPEGWKTALACLAGLIVFSGAVYGITLTRLTGVKAPDSITVDGKPYSLQHGRIYLYFFDPECSHCDAAAKRMAQYKWKEGAKVVAVATVNPQWADDFVKATKLKALASGDIKPLREVFSFGDPPFGVALEHGRQVKQFIVFEGDEPAKELRQMGWVE